ncbi:MULTISPECIES: hypothetical protein [unclassified Acinetobacter]|nr:MULTISPECIES: hypothetical protein [unclassified Acinetobacter]
MNSNEIAPNDHYNRPEHYPDHQSSELDLGFGRLTHPDFGC